MTMIPDHVLKQISRLRRITPLLLAGGWRARWPAWSWWASSVALVAFTGGLSHATATQVSRLTRELPSEPPEVIQDVVVRNVPDELGRRATFRILLFSDEFRWQLNSWSVLESGHRRPVFTNEMKAVLNDAHEIICVGTQLRGDSRWPDAGPGPQNRRTASGASRRADRYLDAAGGIAGHSHSQAQHWPSCADGADRQHVGPAACCHHTGAGQRRSPRRRRGAPHGYGAGKRAPRSSTRC